MRYWLDCEFIEDGKTIDLISIGIVAEDGREYYAISTEFNPKKASQWVKDNVLVHLPPRYPAHPMNGGGSPRIWEESRAWKSREVIAIEVMAFLKNLPIADLHHFERSGLEKFSAKLTGTTGMSYHPRPKIQDIYGDRLFGEPPEVWADYASYDWVAFCHLFGAMMDLPKGFPMYINDLQQWSRDLGNPELPEQQGIKHHALHDARYDRQIWEFLRSYSEDCVVERQ